MYKDPDAAPYYVCLPHVNVLTYLEAILLTSSCPLQRRVGFDISRGVIVADIVPGSTRILVKLTAVIATDHVI